MSAVLDSRGAPTVGLGWALVGLAAVALLLMFGETAAAMEHIWRTNNTFAHAYLVPVISAWLIWRARARLAGLPRRSMPALLIPMAIACGAWVLGQAAGVNALSQFALVTMLVLLVPLLLGRRVAGAIAFPLLFLYFAVPFGTFLVPLFIEWTADFTVYALRASGVPVFREGAQFVIPSGAWSVVEACAGVRYLIATVMVGALFAHLNFQSTRRRAIFMAFAVAIPIVANWLRAYMIVMIGHLSDNRLAVGVDHLLYGWIFFGIVVGLLFWVGSRWAEEPMPAGSRARAAMAAPAPDRRVLWTAAGLVALLLLTQVAKLRLELPAGLVAPAVRLPQRLSTNWDAADAPTWTPAYSGARAADNKVYRSGTDEVGAWIAFYRDQGGRERMVTSSNALVESDSSQWSVVGKHQVKLVVDGRLVVLPASQLRGAPLANAREPQRLVVWRLYWVGGQLMASDARAKLALGLQRLQGRGDDSFIIMLYTQLAGSEAPGIAVADATLRRFAADNLSVLMRQIDVAAGQAAAGARTN